jgi:hypothetical protein
MSRVTSDRLARLAGEALADKHSSEREKSLAASVLSQAYQVGATREALFGVRDGGTPNDRLIEARRALGTDEEPLELVGDWHTLRATVLPSRPINMSTFTAGLLRLLGDQSMIAGISIRRGSSSAKG